MHAARHYIAQDNGLVQVWEGRISWLMGGMRQMETEPVLRYSMPGLFSFSEELIRILWTAIHDSGSFSMSGTSGTLPSISGIFYMHNFLIKDPGKRVQCDGCAGNYPASIPGTHVNTS